ncbi:acyl dehydratase [Tsukamurella sp. PLM1]|uniref:acyl dehydratase n=1 Tax=Tsukamurella sp. PLM1 TaxID=2929795 RepID=UPI0020C1384F|nr:acyl dehydratase [Tsukamurella sp. PLM1]
MTLTDGMAAVHASIVGNRLPLSLDAELAQAVAGRRVVSPALAWDVSIGQSTLATQHVRANLFYRGLCFSRLPAIGDTLHTVTTVEALRENSRRPGRPATGLAVLRITTSDQDGRAVLDYRRCAMILLSPGAPETGRADDFSRAVDLPDDVDLFASVADWDLGSIGTRERAARNAGDVLRVLGGDVVSNAPELARLTGNVARVHHDAGAGGGTRLVYGGHGIGLAFHHLCQALPEIVTVAGWHQCDHVGPVREGDLLASTVEIESVLPHQGGATALGVRVVTVRRDPDGSESEVLHWRPVVIVA